MKIFIHKYNSAGNATLYKYEIRNIASFDQAVEIPVQAMAFPEANSDACILTKAEGNTESITISWTILKEDNSPVLDVSGNYVNSFTNTDAIGGTATWDPRYPEGAYLWFINTFEKKGITTEEKYRIEILDDDNTRPLLNKLGIPSRINISKGAQDPAVYNATMEFVVGNDITAPGSS